MGASKSYQYSNSSQVKAMIFGALSNPARIEIIRAIYIYPEIRAIDLVNKVKLCKGAINRHLKILKDAGLVTFNYEHHHYVLSLKRVEILDIIDKI